MEDLNQTKASRLLRILYVIWVLLGIISIIYIPSQLIVHQDAIATATNISSNTLLFKIGVLGSLLTQILFIIIPMLLYKLFEKIDRFQAALMVVLALVSVPITMYNESNKLIMLKLLNTPDLMMHSLDLYNQSMIISMIFWGLWLFPLAILILKSGYLPKSIGYLLIISGFGYVLGSFTEILFPDASTLLSIFELLTFGELIFIIWLVFKGPKLDRNKISI